MVEKQVLAPGFFASLHVLPELEREREKLIPCPYLSIRIRKKVS